MIVRMSGLILLLIVLTSGESLAHRAYDIDSPNSPSTVNNIFLNVLFHAHDIDDPNKHREFVDDPPAEGTLAIHIPSQQARTSVGPLEGTLSGSASWLPITFNIDEEGNLSGTNTATVAGFNNVENSITGTIGSEGFFASITLGNQGELFGVPITFHVEITQANPELVWPFLLTPLIHANDTDESLTISTGEPLSVNVALEDGFHSDSADWWVVAYAYDQFFSFSLTSNNWESGLTPVYQGPLFDLADTMIFGFPEGLPAGYYIFYFGVDQTPNGSIDLETLTYDFVNVEVQ